MVICLSIILVILVILLAGERGVSTVFALAGNMITYIIGIYVISHGINVYIVTMLCAIVFTMITLFAQNGINLKTKSSVISVLITMVLLIFSVGIIVKNANLGGFGELLRYQEEIAFLYNQIKINSNDLFISVVLLSLLGAIMDTSLSISSAIFEVYRNNNKLRFNEIMKSGDNIGRSILGTTVNTLIFAGMGESLLLIIIMAREKYDLAMILNSNAFFSQLLIILVANIGCIIIIPLTSFITSCMLKRAEKVSERNYYSDGQRGNASK